MARIADRVAPVDTHVDVEPDEHPEYRVILLVGTRRVAMSAEEAERLSWALAAAAAQVRS